MDDLFLNLQYLRKEKETLEREILDLKDQKFIEKFSLHEPVYKFSNSKEYKEKLYEIRQKQKKMLKENEAAICLTNWAVKGSSTVGENLINSIITQSIKNFNLECERVFSRIQFNNFEIAKERIVNLFLSINEINDPLQIG